MKRVNVLIQNLKQPEITLQGYALAQELGVKRIAFFTMQKLPPESELRLTYTYHGEEYTYLVTMTQLHEQISSGRIMTAIPDDSLPFPALKFYRCFASVQSRTAKEKAPPELHVVENAVDPTDALASLVVPTLDTEPKAA